MLRSMHIPERDIHSPAWAATAAALVAMVSLYMSGRGYDGIWLIAAALVAAHFVPLRITRNVIVVWLVRVAMFVAIIMTTGRRRSSGSAWFLDPDYVNLFGYLLGGELLLQVWQRRKKSAPHGEILLLTCLMMLAATNTFERDYLRWLIPVFAVFLAFSLRAFAQRAAPAPAARFPVFALRWAALLVMLAIGFGAAAAIYEYGQRVTIFPLSEFFRKGNFDSIVAVSPAPYLSSTYNIQASPTRVLLIEGTYPDGHLRGASFDRYSDGGWDPPVDQRNFERIDSRRLDAEAEGKRLRITRLAHEMGLIYVPLESAAISAQGDAIEWERDHGRMLKSIEIWTNRFTYDIALPRSPDHQGPVCLAPSKQARAKYLAVPPSIAATIEPLASRIATEHDARKRIVQIAAYLQSNHKYSLQVDRGEGDPLVDFLENKKDAHCQYFAAAAVMLMRAAGIPSRFVNGYYVHEHGGPGMVVRQHDAHAWAEAFIDKVGWITVDATPASGRPDQLFGSTISRWDRFREWLRDLAQQPMLVVRSLPWTRMLIAVAVFAAAYILWKVIGKVRLRRLLPKTGINYLYPRSELAEIAMAFDRLLRRLGVAVNSNRTWREQLSNTRGAGAMDPQLIAEFLARYEQTRFGGDDPGSLARLRELLRQLQPPETR